MTLFNYLLYPTIDSYFINDFYFITVSNIRLLHHYCNNYWTPTSFLILHLNCTPNWTSQFFLHNVRLYPTTDTNFITYSYLKCTQHYRPPLHNCTQYKTPTSLLYPTLDPYFITVLNNRLLLLYCTQHQTHISLLTQLQM